MSDRRGSTTAIGRWCESHRVTYAQLAERVGISRRTIISIATGRSLPKAKDAAALMRETGVSFEMMVAGHADAAPRGALGAVTRKGVMR